MGILAYVPIINELLGIAKEAVVDKDKLNEINLKIMELTHSFQMAMISSQTVPWVDALVKFMYAMVALAAPLGSFAITCAGLWFHYKGVAIDPMTHAAIDGTFPGWRALRHVEKKAGVTIPTAAPSKITRTGPPR